jgi:hypothetical protein
MAHMTDEELIKRALIDYPVYYLMYPGGTGGEFLSNLISSYSNKFRSSVSKKITVTDKNRTSVWLVPFFQTVSSCRLKRPIGILNGIDELVLAIKEQHNFLNLNIKESTDQAIAYLTKEENPPLLRCHVSTNSYFHNNNTYLILPDNVKWHEYKEILIFLKALINKHYCPTDKEKIKFFEYDLSSLTSNPDLFNLHNSALDWVIKNNITDLYEIQLVVIRNSHHVVELTASFDEIFNTDPVTLFKKYSDIMCKFGVEYEYNFNRLNDKVISVIKYSEIFKKGYLENIFDIDSDEFHKKLIEWHEKNLELMSTYDFDTTPYIL